MPNHAEKRLGVANDHITAFSVEFHGVIARIKHNFASATAQGLSLQFLENATPLAATPHIFVNRHESYLDLVRGVEMQPSACQCFPRRIEKEKMERRTIHRITLAPALLTPWPAQNSPAEIKVGLPFVRGRGTSHDQRLIRRLHNIRQYMSYKM